VPDLIPENGSATLELTASAFSITLIVGLGIGLLAGRFRDTPIDVGGRLFGIVIYAAPVFFLGFLLQLLFGVVLGWLPTSGQASPITDYELDKVTHLYVVDAIITANWSALNDVLLHLILPSVTLGLAVSGVLIRLVRVNLLQTMKGDYVEAARARGIGETRVVIHHAFRNALVPVITVAGLQFAILLGGAVLTEETFNWPGIGSELIRYLNERDYIAVQGIITVFAVAVVIVSLLIDLINAFVDPRVRY
jgi:peptide/nickel transport system permease protein